MAIDSKEKRQNIIGVGRPYLRNHFPVATPDEQWRIASGIAYGGNALSAGVVTGQPVQKRWHSVPHASTGIRFAQGGSRQ